MTRGIAFFLQEQVYSLGRLLDPELLLVVQDGFHPVLSGAPAAAPLVRPGPRGPSFGDVSVGLLYQALQEAAAEKSGNLQLAQNAAAGCRVSVA